MQLPPALAAQMPVFIAESCYFAHSLWPKFATHATLTVHAGNQLRFHLHQSEGLCTGAAWLIEYVQPPAAAAQRLSPDAAVLVHVG